MFFIPDLIKHPHQNFFFSQNINKKIPRKYYCLYIIISHNINVIYSIIFPPDMIICARIFFSLIPLKKYFSRIIGNFWGKNKKSGDKSSVVNRLEFFLTFINRLDFWNRLKIIDSHRNRCKKYTHSKTITSYPYPFRYQKYEHENLKYIDKW